MANISKVYLMNVPLEDDMRNTLYFASASNQQAYFNGNIGKTYTDVSYQSDTRTFRCKDQYDTVRNYNYLMYQNTAYSNKWFYCFIKKVVHKSDGYTDIIFEVDPIQTFMFDITVKPSFVEREHTNNDTIGNNTIPEQLEMGDYVEANSAPVDVFKYGPGYSAYAMGCTKLLDRMVENHTPINVGNIPDGMIYVGFNSMSDLKTVIQIFNDEGHADYINCVFVCPKACFSNYISYSGYNTSSGIYSFKMSMTFAPGFQDSYALTADSKLAGNYTPRNNKLLTYPFRYIQMSNNSGSVANYHYEYFKNPLDGTIDTTPSFNLYGYASPGCDIKVYPTNYKGIVYNYDEGLSYAKLAVGSWLSDVYTNWLTQNGVNIATGFISDIASVGVGIATAPAGGGVGITSGIMGIANKVGQIYEHSMQPPQAEGATNVGNCTYSQGRTCITFKQMSIKPEFSAIIDSWFDMFGYATHKVKVPNTAHRENWWYTKTVNANIIGNVPNDYLNKIKDAYNNGITFWKNASNFLNYSVSNGIV